MVICTLEMKLRFHSGSSIELAKRNTSRFSTALLPEEVVDPVDRLLGEGPVEDVVELAGRRPVAPEGLLDDDPAVLVEPDPLEALDHVVEQRRRDGQEEQRPLDAGVPHPLGQAVEGRGLAVVARQVGEVVAQAAQDLVVDLVDLGRDARRGPARGAARRSTPTSDTPMTGPSSPSASMW